jgi:hypothetical protein
MTEQLRPVHRIEHPTTTVLDVDGWEVFCYSCQRSVEPMTEQARETPEPLTPEEAIDALLALLPGTLGHDRAILAAAENIATVALRAVTPDPAEPCGAPANGGLCIETRGHNMGRADVPDNHRAATPDPAEPGLREALQGAVDAWTAEYGPDDNAPWVTKALRALSDTTEGQS